MFQFVLKLVVVKKVRQKLTQMRRYLAVCRIADELRLVRESIGNKRHLMQTVDMYSVADLVAVENGTLPEFLRKVHINFERHIRNCVVSCGIVTGSNWNHFISPQQICSAKAYLCEVCNNDEILFPFDDCAIACIRCNSVSHRACHVRKNMQCLKCTRLRIREQLLRNEILDAANGN